MFKVKSVFCLIITLIATAGSTPLRAGQNSDVSALTLLLRLYDTIAAQNPGYDDTLRAIAGLDPQQQEKRLAPLVERNARDPLITARVDSLLSSPAYDLYYRHFGNITPDVHRRVFAALPYQAIAAPGDIGHTQLELFRHRESLAALIKTVSLVTIDRPIAIALRWVPPGDHAVPPTYYIMDGNGDAFAKDSAVGFDLYGVILAKRPESTRYDKLADIPATEIETVLAHEFQHVFAQPYLYPATRHFDTWQALWEDIIIRRIISEGVATQCNPPSGFRKMVFDDSVIVLSWLNELNRVLGQIRRGETTADSVRAWLDRSYQDAARQLLAEYLKRTSPDGDPEKLMAEHVAERPGGVYVLGWWMTSHIAAAPGGHDLVIQLLTEPHKLFDLYNATVTDPKLKIAL